VPRGPSVDVVREIVRLGVHGRTTSLEAWMTDNYDALKAELMPRRVNWQALADRLHAEKLTNAEGGRLTAHTARKTWQRVRANMGAGSGKTEASKAPVKSTPRPVVHPALPIDDPDDDQPDLNSFVKERR
jgi:hypothetical protein